MTPGLEHFRPQVHYLNKLDMGPNMKALCLVVSDKKTFCMFSLNEPIDYVIPRTVPLLWLKGYNSNKLSRLSLGTFVMRHIKYQSSITSGFREEGFPM